MSGREREIQRIFYFFFLLAASKRKACFAAAAKAKRNNKRNASETALMNENAGCKRKQRRRRRNKHTRAVSVNANANCKFQLERALSLSQHNSSRTREFIFHIPFEYALARSLARTYFRRCCCCRRGERNVRALSVCVFYVVIAFHDTNSNGLAASTHYVVSLMAVRGCVGGEHTHVEEADARAYSLYACVCMFLLFF